MKDLFCFKLIEEFREAAKVCFAINSKRVPVVLSVNGSRRLVGDTDILEFQVGFEQVDQPCLVGSKGMIVVGAQ